MREDARHILDVDRYRRAINKARPFALCLGLAAAWAVYWLTDSAGIMAGMWFGVYMGTLIICTESLYCRLRRQENHR